jgi:hypothetical protein
MNVPVNTKEIRLPRSGAVVKIKKPGVLGMKAILGGMPNARALAAQFANAEAGDADQRTAPDRTMEPSETMQFMIGVVCGCAVDPRFAEVTTPTTQNVDDLEWEDFQFLFKEALELTGFKEALERVDP